MVANVPETHNRLLTREIAVKNFTELFVTPRPATADTANRSLSVIYPKVVLPQRIYEALPATYMSVGTLFILGAIYIGVGHGPVVGYFAVGLACMFAGVAVAGIRRRERSR